MMDDVAMLDAEKVVVVKVGVLALQGAFEEHEKCLRAVGCTTVQVRVLFLLVVAATTSSTQELTHCSWRLLRLLLLLLLPSGSHSARSGRVRRHRPSRWRINRHGADWNGHPVVIIG
jgi:hypothetical protein